MTPRKTPSAGTAKDKLLFLLDSLQHTKVGTTLYQHLEGLLNDLEEQHTYTEEVYLKLLQHLLNRLATQLPPDSSLRPQVKLLQTFLTPPLSTAELSRLEHQLEELTEEELNPESTTEDVVESTLNQLLHDLGIEAAAADQPPDQEAASQEAASYESSEETPAPAASDTESAETVQRRHMDDKQQRFQEMQKTLTQQVTEVIKANEEFGVFLEVELEALRQAASAQEMESLREMLCREVEKLLQRHRSLASKLDRSYSYLQIIETDSQLLTDELTRVHLLSLTDELTGLPNRRAFTRRLEDEVARVQRYGYPMSLALIDLDGFKAINDKYGHAAGDEVLRSFATNILSMFRHHDMVSRYGGEEFAVLLPNTDTDGALRALHKVQKRATESTFQFNNNNLPLPTFSAGLALYKPGETPGNLIERADNALYRAKRLGRNRVELGTHETMEKQQQKE